MNILFEVVNHNGSKELVLLLRFPLEDDKTSSRL